jgi:uncharacterized membrane protein (DUF485 family)
MPSMNINSMKTNVKFQELVRLKNGLSWSLAAITVMMFFSYLMLVALNPSFVGTRVSLNSSLTYGIALGLANVVGAIVLTGAYVAIANGRIDRLTRELHAEAQS